MIPLGGGRSAPVYEITEVGSGPKSELSGRQVRYLISMGIRTACFLGAVAASGWLRWVLVVGAFALPYFSVVIANAGRERAAVLPVAVFTPRGRSGHDRSDDTPTRPG